MNYKFLAKNGLSLAFGLGLLGVLAMLVPMISGLSAFEALAEDVNARSIAPESDIFYPGLYVAIIFTVLAFGLTILLGIYSTATDLKGSKKGLISILVLAVLFIVLYAISSGDISPRMTEVLNNPDYHLVGKMNLYKWLEAGIDGCVALLIIAFVVMVLMEIRNFFKNS